MKIVVTYKWAADPAEASVSGDGVVDFSRAKPVISDYDDVAMEFAKLLATANSAELVGVCLGGSAAAAPLATKAALSRGLDSVVVAADDSFGSLDSAATANALAAAITTLGGVDLVISGDSSVDVGARIVPALLAAKLGLPALTDVDSATPASGGWDITREVPEGVQGLHIDGPAVLAVSSAAVAAKAPGMKDVLAAAKKPVTVLGAAEVGSPTNAGGVTSRAKLNPPARKGIVIDTSDPVAAAAELVAKLKADGVELGGN